MSGWFWMSVRVDQWESVMNFFRWCVFSLRYGIWCDKHEPWINTPLHTALLAFKFCPNFTVMHEMQVHCCCFTLVGQFLLFYISSQIIQRSQKWKIFFLMCDLYTSPSLFLRGGGQFLLYVDTCCNCTYCVLSKSGFHVMCHRSCQENINFYFRHLCTLGVFVWKLPSLWKVLYLYQQHCTRPKSSMQFKCVCLIVVAHWSWR
jgi:hypothetical protein